MRRRANGSPFCCADARKGVFARNDSDIDLSYVDENGNDYPSIKVADGAGRKINTPQFVPASLDLENAGNIADFIYGCFR